MVCARKDRANSTGWWPTGNPLDPCRAAKSANDQRSGWVLRKSFSAGEFVTMGDGRARYLPGAIAGSATQSPTMPPADSRTEAAGSGFRLSCLPSRYRQRMIKSSAMAKLARVRP
jgi:hypothetical protein